VAVAFASAQCKQLVDEQVFQAFAAGNEEFIKRKTPKGKQ
jgi:hypothetical protein